MSNNDTNQILTFGIGLIIGSLITYCIIKLYNQMSLNSQLNILLNSMPSKNTSPNNINTPTYSSSKTLNTSNLDISLNDKNITYKNNEIWKIYRDDNGLINSLEVTRDAKSKTK